MAKKANPVGRPRLTPDSGDRVHVGFRVTPELRQQLEDGATENGRSMSQEAEFRLEESFRTEGLLAQALLLRYGPKTAGFLLLFGEAIRLIDMIACDVSAPRKTIAEGPLDPSDWTANAFAYDQIKQGLVEILEKLRPPGSPHLPDDEEDAVHANIGKEFAHRAMRSAETFAQTLVAYNRNHLLWDVLNSATKAAGEKGKRK